MTRTRTAGAALLALAVAGSLAACADDDAGAATLAELQASASASPGLSAEDQAKQKVIDEAQGVLDEYRQTELDVAHDGYGSWSLLTHYWGPELAESQAPTYRAWADEGRYSTGESAVVTSDVTDYSDRASGYEEVEFTVCLDRSELRQFEKDGTEMPWPEGQPRQYETVYRLAHSGPDGRWQVHEATSESDEEC